MIPFYIDFLLLFLLLLLFFSRSGHCFKTLTPLLYRILHFVKQAVDVYEEHDKIGINIPVSCYFSYQTIIYVLTMGQLLSLILLNVR